MDCGSALAEAEVEYQDKVSPAVDVAFDAVDAAAISAACGSDWAGDIAVPIWTTTPWTLPANMAVCLNATLDYVLIRAGDRALVVAKALAETCTQRFGLEELTVLGECQGNVLEGLKLKHCFLDREVPIILGDHVTTDAGTGAVHTAPAHGQEDFEVGRKYDLEIYNPVGGNGVYLPDTELFAGQHVFKANAEIVALLQERGALLKHEDFEHSYPHCWRHKTPIIFRATPQWFVSMSQQGLLEKARRAVDEVRWLPEWGKARIEGMLDTRPDWCISRQRTWGVPIALFVHVQTGELHPRTSDLMEQVAQLIEKQGIEAWFELEAETLLGAEAKDYEKVTDTLDVWFDSGVTHACVLRTREELQFPADLYLEGSDQHRGWFQSSLLTAVAIDGTAPYKNVLTHGFTVDSEGRKMSKSIGNIIAPKSVINNLGADVLRLWVAATDYRGELAVSDEIFNRTADSYRRIRNTARFLLSNLDGFDPQTDIVAFTELLSLDQWAVDRCALLQDEIKQAYDDYQFHVIYQKLHNFCANDLGGFYLDIVKDRAYTTQENSRARRSAQTAMFHIAQAMVRWIAPILSFTAEEIWENMPGQREASVMLTQWYDGLETLPADAAMGRDYWQRLIDVRTAVNKEMEVQRAAGTMKGSLDASVDLFCDAQLLADLGALEEELRFLLISSSARLLDLAAADDTAAPTESSGLRLTMTPSADAKCERCWHRRPEVGSAVGHPTLCGRCVENIEGEGEIRRFV